jgi:hypothetical protein
MRQKFAILIPTPDTTSLVMDARHSRTAAKLKIKELDSFGPTDLVDDLEGAQCSRLPKQHVLPMRDPFMYH